MNSTDLMHKKHKKCPNGKGRKKRCSKAVRARLGGVCGCKK